MSTKMIYSKGHHAYKKSCQQLDKFIRQKERLLRDIKENNHNIYKWQCAVNALKDEENKKTTKQQSNSADVTRLIKDSAKIIEDLNKAA